ncbi:hypothetical protein FHS96_000944 [Sphingomonas zeicaulis]|uniref:hypothetical protein n=1 Tax=Sphingomonas zeicaulis TaxID=1632740 RepID=UPI003D1FE181
MTAKKPMQADGRGSRGADDGVSQPRTSGRSDPGESGGGAYPNPWQGKRKSEFGTWSGHGGQSKLAYHGSGQLGDEATGDADGDAKKDD